MNDGSAVFKSLQQRLKVPLTSNQQRLHEIIEGLYRKVLTISPITAELLRIADHLGMACIVDTCCSFIKQTLAKQLPVEVWTPQAACIELDMAFLQA